MPNFTKISSKEPIAKVIESAFDMKLDVSGAWGYSLDEAIVINRSPTTAAQLEYTLASIRAHIEMNMTLPSQQRYGGINLKEATRESIANNNTKLDKVTYKITAMLESNYSKFIDEYKEGHGTKEFDMAKHFKEREEATLHRVVVMWFDVAAV